jgi:pre-peptidase
VSHPTLRVVLASSCAMLLSVAALAATRPESETNDTPQTANAIRCNDLVTASISPEGDVDFFQFTLNRTSDIAIFTTTSGDTVLTLFDSDGTTVIDSDDDSGVGLGSHLGHVDLPAGTYFVSVAASSPTETFGYSTRVFCPSVVEEVEPNDDLGSASPTSCVPGGFSGDLASADDVDYWTYTIGTAAHVQIQVLTVPELAEHALTLYREDGTYLTASHVTADSGVLGAHLEVGLAAGTYFWRLTTPETGLHYDAVFRCVPVADCLVGNVNTSDDVPANVLTINGSTGTVTIGRDESIDLALAASPSGPDPANYVLWLWPGLPTNPFDLSVSGVFLGCTANPTPFNPMAQPQPFRCMQGVGMPDEYCTDVRHFPAPDTAPFSVHREIGFGHSLRITFQAVLQDDGSPNALGFSVSNAVILKID